MNSLLMYFSTLLIAASVLVATRMIFLFSRFGAALNKTDYLEQQWLTLLIGFIKLSCDHPAALLYTSNLLHLCSNIKTTLLAIIATGCWLTG